MDPLRRRRPLRWAVVVIASMVLAACQGPASPASPTGSGPSGEFSWVQVDEWVFPSTAMTTGALAVWGNKLQFARQYAVDQINAAGGIAGKPVRLDVYDDQLDPNVAASIFADVSDWALAAMGPTADTAVRGAAPVAVANEFLHFVSCTGAEVAAEYVPWVYSSLSPSRTDYPAGIKAWVKRNPGMTKVVPIVSSDHAMWATDTQVVEEVLHDLGIETTEWVEVPEGTLDFGPPALKALSEEADGYWFAANPLAIANVVIELEERGMTDKENLLIFPHGEDPQLWEVGKDRLEGAYLIRYLDMDTDADRWQAFVDYSTEAGEEPFFCSPDIIDEVYLLKAAIEGQHITGDPAKLAEERIKIRDYICDVKDFDYIMGQSSASGCFKETLHFIFQVKDNAFRLDSRVDDEGNDIPPGS